MEQLKNNIMTMLSIYSLAGVSLSRCIWKRIEEGLIDLIHIYTGEELAKLVTEAIYSDYYKSFPRDFVYIGNLLRWLNSIWTKNGWEGTYLFESTTEGEPMEIVYKTYANTDIKNQVTLLESVEGITRGTTGLSSWGAGRVLGTWCLDNQINIRGKNLVELGAGIGQTATTLLTYINPNCLPRSYVATDCHPHVLSILHHNLSLLGEHLPSKTTLENFQRNMNKKLKSEEPTPENYSSWSPESELSYKGTNINVQQLDWRHPQGNLPSCDIVLAADVVYARHLLPYLAEVLRRLLTPNHVPKQKDDDKNTPIEAFIACTRRSQETIDEFLTELKCKGLHATSIFQMSLNRDESLFGYDESHLPVKVFRITKEKEDL